MSNVSQFSHRPKRVIISGRSVAIFCHNGQFFALDANCYHSAGPLEKHTGDIEDINGEPCVRCPLHQYIISLSSGHSFYEAVDIQRHYGGISIRSLGYRSKGPKQRCHKTKVQDGRLLVCLSAGPELESDRYAHL
ncbi:Rieske domain-containing protein [Babesia ovis]|uniref:Rieske domain-containing protein n=1 Tax=Babesia ovis TaxID=5869 RepID=A0A9W5WUA2_BABOV|nr:Rieske domain-containing protein [Babesia ovis]